MQQRLYQKNSTVHMLINLNGCGFNAPRNLGYKRHAIGTIQNESLLSA